MKASIKFIAFAVLLVSMACGAKKSTQSKMENNQQEMAAKGTDESQGEVTVSGVAKDIDGSSDSDNSVQTSNGSTGGNANVNSDATTAPVNEEMDNFQMYTELQMTEDQIQEFENAIQDFKTQRQNTASGEMMGTVSDERDRQLEKILSTEQYSAYQTWKDDN